MTLHEDWHLSKSHLHRHGASKALEQAHRFFDFAMLIICCSEYIERMQRLPLKKVGEDDTSCGNANENAM
jgi:hypothetical protein